MTEAPTQEALKALDKAKKYNQPFYLYMSHYAIHVPIDKDVRFYDKYKKKRIVGQRSGLCFAHRRNGQKSRRYYGLAGKEW